MEIKVKGLRKEEGAWWIKVLCSQFGLPRSEEEIPITEIKTLGITTYECHQDSTKAWK